MTRGRHLLWRIYGIAFRPSGKNYNVWMMVGCRKDDVEYLHGSDDIAGIQEWFD